MPSCLWLTSFAILTTGGSLTDARIPWRSAWSRPSGPQKSCKTVSFSAGVSLKTVPRPAMPTALGPFDRSLVVPEQELVARKRVRCGTLHPAPMTFVSAGSLRSGPKAGRGRRDDKEREVGRGRARTFIRGIQRKLIDLPSRARLHGIAAFGSIAVMLVHEQGLLLCCADGGLHCVRAGTRPDQVC
jgi:hypothetical protein